MRVHFVSSWYPDRYSPYSGVFVKKQVDALVAQGHSVSVENPEIYPAPPGPVPDEVWQAMRTLASRDRSALLPVYDESTKVPAPVPARSGMLGRARAFQQALELKRSFLPVDADVLHAHLGIPTGLALLELGDRPLVVTEHQSTLKQVFAQPGAVSEYRRVVQEAAAFLCVSDHLKLQVIDAIGHEFDPLIQVLPNVVDLDEIPFRLRTEEKTSHWIYIGTVARHKGAELLLQSFRQYAKTDSDARVTIVGSGPHLPWVERFVAANGLNSVVDLVGWVPHDQVGSHLDKADVMVHLSFGETFGIASLEGIGAGLPVVSLRNGGAESAWGDFESEVGRLLPLDVSPADVADAVSGLYHSSRLDPIAARHKVEDRFSAEVVADRLADIYQKVT